MPPSLKLPRQRCQRCARPLSHCLCEHARGVSNRTHVLILQHPDEARHPLNTARLALLGLQHAELWVGESFPQLGARLGEANRSLLLFPDAKEAPSPGAQSPDLHRPPSPDLQEAPLLGMQEAPSSDQQPDAELQDILLIVPDGTWRKAGRIVNANPALQCLPRLSLQAKQPSGYIVRKASKPHALSTVEAIVCALELLEPGQDFRALLAPFQALVQQQIKAMGPEVFRRNYAGK